jgi:hypothetical protein
MTTTPEPADRLDATTNVAANGPTDGTLAPASESYAAAASGPSPACLSRMIGNGHVLVLRGARHSNVPGLPGPCESDASSDLDASAVGGAAVRLLAGIGPVV